MRVIIQGCGRSGTSILGELFEHLPLFEYYFEPHLEDLDNEILKGQQNIAIKVPKGGGVLTSGLACNMDKLINLIGDDYKLLWIVRNPLDTICSLKAGIESNWAHNPKPPNYLEMMNYSWYIKSAFHWKFINEKGLKSLQNYGIVQIVKYESLVTNSENVVTNILKFLGLEKNNFHLDDYIRNISDNVDGSYHAKKQVYWFRDDHTKRVNRYKENLNQQEIEEIKEVLNNIPEIFGYYLSEF